MAYGDHCLEIPDVKKTKAGTLSLPVTNEMQQLKLFENGLKNRY